MGPRLLVGGKSCGAQVGLAVWFTAKKLNFANLSKTMNKLFSALGLPGHAKPTTQVASGFRWAYYEAQHFVDLPWPIESSESLASAIDVFIDRNLNFMPLPRLSRKLDVSKTADEHDVWASILEVLDRFDSAVNHDVLEEASLERPSDILNGAAHVYENLVPMCSVLRDLRMQMPAIAIGVALLALDLRWCKGISLKFISTINSWAFPWQSESFQSVLRACPPFAFLSDVSTLMGGLAVPGPNEKAQVVDEAFLVQFLIAVDSTLQERAMQKAISKLDQAPAEWVRVDSALRMFEDSVLEGHVDESIKKTSESVGLSVTTLRSWAYIKDLAQEMPEIRFRVHSK
jgi:hypothetical protein